MVVLVGQYYMIVVIWYASINNMIADTADFDDNFTPFPNIDLPLCPSNKCLSVLLLNVNGSDNGLDDRGWVGGGGTD